MDISDYSPHATARRFDAGTPPVPNIYAGVAGLGAHRRRRACPRSRRTCRRSNTRLIAGLDELGADVVTPRDPARRGPLVCVRSTDAPALVASLAEERHHCSLRDDEPPGRARTSTTPTTTSTRCSQALARRRAPARLTKWLRATSFRRPRQIAYGDHPTRSGTCTFPPATAPGRRSCWSTAASGVGVGPHADDAARRDLARRGYAVWNIEYRRVGQEGGGWPGTLEDAAAAARRARRRSTRSMRRASSRSVTPPAATSPLWLAGAAGSCRRRPGAAPRVRPLRRRLAGRRRSTSCAAPGTSSAAEPAARSSAAGPTRCPSATRWRRPRRSCRSACRSCSCTGRRRGRAAVPEPGLRRGGAGGGRRGRARRARRRRPLRRDRAGRSLLGGQSSPGPERLL